MTTKLKSVLGTLKSMAADSQPAPRKWDRRGPIAPGDQRLALDSAGNIYLYDNSGPDPDNTEDGPLHAKKRVVTVGNDSSGVWFGVPVIQERYASRSDSTVPVTAAGAAKLVSDYGFDVKINSSAKPLFDAYAVLLNKAKG